MMQLQTGTLELKSSREFQGLLSRGLVIPTRGGIKIESCPKTLNP